MMSWSQPSWFVRLENWLLFCLVLYVYLSQGFSFIWFVALWILPDVGMIGFAINKSFGTLTYNLLHTYIGPLIAFFLYVLEPNQILLQLALIWTSHISLDRFIGYGLKYKSHFKHTHISKL